MNPRNRDRLLLVVGSLSGALLLWYSAGLGSADRPGPSAVWQTGLVLVGFVLFLAILCRTEGRWDWLMLLPMFGLTLVKLWLVSGQDLCALAHYRHDDLLFVRLAQYIRQGCWLGPYDSLTLAKGPGYPIWIALGSRAGLPLLIGEQLLYTAACAVLTGALRPLIAHRLGLLALYSLLLFNPMTFTIQVLRVIREGIYPAMTLLVIACAVGIHTRRDRSLRELLPWTGGLGVALAWFWLVREEAVWLLPSLALLLVPTAWDLVRHRYSDWRPRLACCLVPVAVWGVVMLAVCSCNWTRYGAFTTCEFRWQPFLAAYGALGRVEPHPWIQHVPVPRETRQRIYAVSPSFRELEPFLEGPLGQGYAQSSAAHFHWQTREPDMAGGWFMWALRDAVELAGHGQDAQLAGAFYARLTKEVNRACDLGQLAAGPARLSMLPPWRSEYNLFLLEAYGRGVGLLFGMQDFQPQTRASGGAEPARALFRQLTRERLSLMTGESSGESRPWGREKLLLLQAIGSIYQKAIPWAATAGGLSLLLALALALRRRESTYLSLLAAALAVAVVVRILLVATIDVTSFRAVTALYLAPAYPLLLLLIALGLLEITAHASRAWRLAQGQAQGTNVAETARP